MSCQKCGGEHSTMACDDEGEQRTSKAQSSFTASVKFVRESAWSDACMAGYEAAQEMRLPKISERWSRPDLRDAWLHGFTTEIRNMMENDKLCREAGQKDHE